MSEEARRSAVPPEFMQRGSTGPVVDMVAEFLRKNGFAVEGLVADGMFGDKMVESIKQFQESVKLDADGCFGPRTRRQAFLVHNFDFDAACRAVSGATSFVQDNGEVVAWEYQTPAELGQQPVSTAAAAEEGFYRIGAAVAAIRRKEKTAKKKPPKRGAKKTKGKKITAKPRRRAGKKR